ncbi:EcsC family protein [Azospirillum sp. TSA6c]|uniref:EcsC family protein n=1 Tax=Azospirillum sp. TSA6c TaxID=709813 RepID=UPI000D65A2C2|nr:EcsC family protein [Azospirillum sp. TSA6c]
MNEYERDQHRAIQAWKAQEPSVVDNIVGTALTPVTWLFNKVVPSSAIEGVLHASDWIAQQTLATKPDVKQKIDDLKLLDDEADSVHNWAIGYASTEGGVTGAVGLYGIPVDIPATVTLSLRTIRAIGGSYGYTETNEMEKQFVLSVLGAAGANTMAEKTAAITTLRSLQVTLLRQTWKKMAEKAAEQTMSREAVLIAIRNLAKQLGINLTKRKALQAIPIIGAGVGAAVNGSYMRDVGWAARRAYQERWLIDRGKIISN